MKPILYSGGYAYHYYDTYDSWNKAYSMAKYFKITQKRKHMIRKLPQKYGGTIFQLWLTKKW